MPQSDPAQLPLAQLIAQGLDHHRAGRLQQAEAMYRQALQQQPEQPDALQLLGVLALQAGQPQAALELIGRSAQIAPTFAAFNNLGEAFRALGRMNEAIASYRKSIELNPNHPDAWGNLSLAAGQVGRIDEMVSALERLAQLLPDRGDVHDRLGAAYYKQGDPYKAAAAHRRAIALSPNSAPAYANLGLALAKTKAFEEAIASCRRAVELAPDAAEAHGMLAVVLDQAGRIEESLAAFERAAAINPKVSDYYGHPGTILERLDRTDEAAELFAKGCAQCPNDPRLFNNHSGVLRRQRKYAEALVAADQAIKLAPGYSDAHGNRALALLALADYERGFAEYEWRWRCDNFTTAPRDFKRPMWDGSDPRGRTILVHTEQGYGDTLQFIRYVPMLAERGATVIVECHHLLRKLIANVRGVSRIVPNGLALPDFDLHMPLMSLPCVFKTTLDTIPREVPYLLPDASRIEAWKSKIVGEGVKVGLIWAGNAKPDARRTVPGEQLKVLVGIEGVSFFSLQKPEAGTMQPPPVELRMTDLSGDLTDFHETAAAMMNLDLILTIDTAGAHLASALGRPTWTLLPWSPDWRWLLDREDSPWYPTMRLFRQSKADQWGDVLERVRAELSKLRG